MQSRFVQELIVSRNIQQAINAWMLAALEARREGRVFSILPKTF